MNDREFLTAFEDCTLPEHLFRHRDHIRMAWLILRRDGWQAGRDNIRAGIQKYAAAHGATGLYHDTITCFYAHVVHHAIQSNPTLDSMVNHMRIDACGSPCYPEQSDVG